ncbi:MAG: hypothetical protein HXY34_11305 [Candidatus Thorarchaeota archaeon]|nr:hypothetical protein [Candidatus Thorarchaeota archaeon]
MAAESELRIDVVFDDSTMVQAVLDRVHAPSIVEELKSRLPIEGKAALLRGEMRVTVGINKGNIKATRQVKRGQVAYMPLGDCLCIYLDEMTTFSPVNVIGRIISADSVLEGLRTVRRGARAVLRQG